MVAEDRLPDNAENVWVRHTKIARPQHMVSAQHKLRGCSSRSRIACTDFHCDYFTTLSVTMCELLHLSVLKLIEYRAQVVRQGRGELQLSTG